MGLLSACDDPCVDLAKKICRCSETQTEQQACIQRVDADAAEREASADERERCADLLDACTCKALAQGELAACGLTSP